MFGALWPSARALAEREELDARRDAAREEEARLGVEAESARSGLEPTTPTTSTPRRRSAST